MVIEFEARCQSGAILENALIAGNFTTTWRMNATLNDLIARRHARDSRVIHLIKRTMHSGTYFSRLFCKSSRSHLGHVNAADYILTGQYIRIDNSTISRDMCAFLFYLIVLCSTLVRSAVCLTINQSRSRTFRTRGSLCRGFSRMQRRNYLSPRYVALLSVATLCCISNCTARSYIFDANEYQ